MKKLQNILLLSIATFIAVSTTGCSSHRNVVSVSDVHGYDKNYGLVPNYEADKQIEAERLAMNLPTQIDVARNMQDGWTTTLTKDVDAFYENEYVQKEDVITYKYKFDKKFYNNAEWRSSEF